MIAPGLSTKNHTSLINFENTSKSILMQDIYHKILQLSKLESNVVIIGEIGSGKKRLANVIHDNSNRSDGPFHSFYCLDIDDSTYQEAFWGHLEFSDEHLILRYDAIEKASYGTLYLDQFSDIPHSYMSKIIDSFVKGSQNLFRYDERGIPRLILSFNQELYQELTHSPVWSYLLKEINPVVVMLPPLRERKEDIPVLIEQFLSEIKKQNTSWKELSISEKALHKCCNYSWPGNIRQLKNALIQGTILSYGQTIECRHLPFSMSCKLPYDIDHKKLPNINLPGLW